MSGAALPLRLKGLPESGAAAGIAPRAVEDQLRVASIVAIPRAAPLLTSLFEALDQWRVRYCVLHGWEALPESIGGDVDLAVHPGDKHKLPSVFAVLMSQDFRLVQYLNYAYGGHYFVFAWKNAQSWQSQAVDIIFEHCRCGLSFDRSDTLVVGRRREKMFWVSSPATQFRYLLIKKVLKGSLPARQGVQLQTLAAALGPEADDAVARLFGRRRRREIVESCRAGAIAPLLVQLRNSLRRNALLRRPFSQVRVAVGECVRRVRRWVRPTGVFVVLLGPDGSGKSTLGRALVEHPTAAFRRSTLFHWRAAVLRHRQESGPVTDPHSRVQHSMIRSMAWLAFQLLDYWLGYVRFVRPLVVRSGLVVFDRYFDDLLVDQKRYRCRAPGWMIEAVRRLIPRPDLLLVLDAPASLVRSRKREVSDDESDRQEAAYRALGIGARVIDASRSPEAVYAATMTHVTAYLARRYERRHAEWF